MSDEPKNLILVKLDQVLAKVDAMEDRLHGELVQVKARLTAVEKQLLNMQEAIAAQWENFDRHEERIRRLEKQ
ncbi:hypothetical protein [Paraburkholderia sp. SIMBA_054]|uniref:hypothetical protein n=1 Tax=Paraburkholderia sp. SIMBA_054 TaxID=3085795 RepID=UPI00397E65CC